MTTLDEWLQSLVVPESVDQEAQALIEGRPPTPRYLDGPRTVASILDLEDELELLDPNWEPQQ